jgi:hypothetical protein
MNPKNNYFEGEDARSRYDSDQFKLHSSSMMDEDTPVEDQEGFDLISGIRNWWNNNVSNFPKFKFINAEEQKEDQFSDQDLLQNVTQQTRQNFIDV